MCMSYPSPTLSPLSLFLPLPSLEAFPSPLSLSQSFLLYLTFSSFPLMFCLWWGLLIVGREGEGGERGREGRIWLLVSSANPFSSGSKVVNTSQWMLVSPIPPAAISTGYRCARTTCPAPRTALMSSVSKAAPLQHLIPVLLLGHALDSDLRVYPLLFPSPNPLLIPSSIGLLGMPAQTEFAGVHEVTKSLYYGDGCTTQYYSYPLSPLSSSFPSDILLQNLRRFFCIR